MDMMFKTWLRVRGEGKILKCIQIYSFIEHKMYKIWETVKIRFDKFVEKSKQKLMGVF